MHTGMCCVLTLMLSSEHRHEMHEVRCDARVNKLGLVQAVFYGNASSYPASSSRRAGLVKYHWALALRSQSYIPAGYPCRQAVKDCTMTCWSLDQAWTECATAINIDGPEGTSLIDWNAPGLLQLVRFLKQEIRWPCDTHIQICMNMDPGEARLSHTYGRTYGYAY